MIKALRLCVFFFLCAVSGCAHHRNVRSAANQRSQVLFGLYRVMSDAAALSSNPPIPLSQLRPVLLDLWVASDLALIAIGDPKRSEGEIDQMMNGCTRTSDPLSDFSEAEKEANDALWRLHEAISSPGFFSDDKPRVSNPYLLSIYLRSLSKAACCYLVTYDRLPLP